MKKIESEKLIERSLVKSVKKVGGWCLKFLSVHINGLPDRICLMPGGKVFFVEVKTTKEKPTKIQLHMHDKLRKMGFRVEVLDSTEGVNIILNLEKNGEICKSI